MIVTVINFLIWLLVLGLVFYLVIWVLGLLGIPVPAQAIKILGAILFLVILLWFVQAMLSGGHFPRMLLIAPI